MSLRNAIDRAGVAILLCFLLVYALVILSARHAPALQDYPDWVYQGLLFSKVLAGHPVTGYALKRYPVPNTLTTVGIGVVAPLLGWQLAAKLWAVLVPGVLAGAAIALVRRCGANGAILLLMSPSVFLGMELWTGNVDFQLGTALLLGTAAILLRDPRPSLRVALLLVLIFFSHMLPCLAALLLISALAVEQRSWRWIGVCLPVLGLVLWYGLARSGSERNLTPVPSWHLIPALGCGVIFLVWNSWHPSKPRSTRWLALALFGCVIVLILMDGAAPQPMAQNFGRAKLVEFSGSFGPIQVVGDAGKALMRPVLFDLFAWPSALLGAVLAFSLGRSWLASAARNSPVRFMATTALALCVLFLLSPLDSLGVTGIDGRFLHLGLCLGLPLVGRRLSRWVVPLALVAGVMCCFNLYQFAAVELGHAKTSLPIGSPEPPGTLSVNLGMRMGYYQALEQQHLASWIFPTAMFREYKP